MPENQIANDTTHSVVFGHTHKKRLVTVPKLNGRVTVLNLACALPDGHIEDYAIGSLTGWSYGVWDLRIENKDIIGHRFVSMLELKEMYGGKRRKLVPHRSRSVRKL